MMMMIVMVVLGMMMMVMMMMTTAHHLTWSCFWCGILFLAPANSFGVFINLENLHHKSQLSKNSAVDVANRRDDFDQVHDTPYFWNPCAVWLALPSRLHLQSDLDAHVEAERAACWKDKLHMWKHDSNDSIKLATMNNNENLGSVVRSHVAQARVAS